MLSLKKLPDNSIDSIVTDPPYGLSFMGKKWDYDVPSIELWKECFRVLKPGGHVLSFGGTRTYHRMVVNIEDAGFEIRDQIMWIYGSGFPKSHNIGKSYDKKVGNDREVVGIDEDFIKRNPNNTGCNTLHHINKDGIIQNKSENAGIITKGSSPYEGWGTALKPANEPICVARKPLSEKTIVDNVIKWGTGGINIDGCRVKIDGIDDRSAGIRTGNFGDTELTPGGNGTEPYIPNTEDRFPANIIFDESAADMLDEQSGLLKSGDGKSGTHKINRNGNTDGVCKMDMSKSNEAIHYGDKGGASRFFYVAKVSKKERNMGLDSFEEKENPNATFGFMDDEGIINNGRNPENRSRVMKNNHPTLKPINLMTYLCRLVTPPNGIVLDPFMGSGSTGISALLEGFRFVGMEMDEDYFKICESRIDNYEEYRTLLKDKK
jgi:site-specific DNA-methyltransferase (adenine-specific)